MITRREFFKTAAVVSGVVVFDIELVAESPLEQLKRRLLAHRAAVQFDMVGFINYGNRGYSGPALRVIYWSEEHQQKFFNFLELKGEEVELDLLPTDTIDSIVRSFNGAADDALAQGPSSE